MIYVNGFYSNIAGTLIHEIQHLIQDYEGFAIGGSSTNPDYHNLMGEVEARNASTRMGFSEAERSEKLLSETEDVAREDQIFLRDNLGESQLAGEKARAQYEAKDEVRFREEEIVDFLSKGETVSQLKGDEFTRKEGKTLTEQVLEYFEEMGGKAISPIFGEVTLDKKGADDSFAHGMGRLKAIAYASVKDVIEQGVLIESDENHKDRGYNTHVVAAPISIKGERYICTVVVKENKKGYTFYLHEVYKQKDLEECGSNPAQKQAVIRRGGAKVLKYFETSSNSNSKEEINADNIRMREREGAEPKKTVKVYKMMRMVNGC